MQAKAAPDLPRQVGSVALKGTETLLRTPVEDLDAALQPARKTEGHVEHGDALALPLQLVPEGLVREPARIDAARRHPVRVPLHRVVSAVFAGKRARRERWPHRGRQRVGRRAQRERGMSGKELAKGRKLVQRRLDELDVAGINADHQDLRWACVRHSLPRSRGTSSRRSDLEPCAELCSFGPSWSGLLEELS
jgi:hypothetical protein